LKEIYGITPDETMIKYKLSKKKKILLAKEGKNI